MKIACCVLALALAAGCTAEPAAQAGPLDRVRLPSGMVVDDGGRLLVASSNSDLLYDDATGGSVISFEPGAVLTGTSSVTIHSAINVRSFAGELAIARTGVRWTPSESPFPDAEACGTTLPGGDLPDGLEKTLAVFPTRGSNTLNVLSIAPDGALACEACGLPAGTGFGDPFSAAIACGAGRKRAFFGYLTVPNSEAVVAELDLVTFALRTAIIGIGQPRGFAYDRDRDRLFLASIATGTPTPLRWIDLAGCTLGAGLGAGGCNIGSATLATLPAGLELRSIALAHSTPGTPRPQGVALRAYVTARLYDASLAAGAGFRTTDFGGLLIVLDLRDDGLGGVQPQVVWTVPIGRGAADVVLLPRSPNWAPGRRDVVAALSVDEGELTIYDDETRSVTVFRQDQATGAPVLGHQPFGLAADPFPAGTANRTARLWIGSYGDSFVTPIDVALEPEVVATFAGPTQLKITGAP